jgi:osmotically-inducible protein OsmY
LTIATTLGLVALVACHHQPEDDDAAAGDAASALAAVAPITDAALATAIDEAIKRDPMMHSQTINASVAHGQIMLGGNVRTLWAKARAGQIASELKGGTSLENDIVVKTSPRSDAEISKALTDAIQRDPATRNAKLKITAASGVVTLHGSVDSSTQRELVADVASHVLGVKQLHVTVEIAHGAPRADSEIAADIVDRFHDDARLYGAHVAVDVNGRSVALSGVTGTLAQRDQASDDAWVSGVTNVDAHAVVVDWQSERVRVHDHVAPPSDAHIADSVRRWLANDATLGLQPPTVAVAHGVVTLMGNVVDFRAQKAAMRDAQRVLGVSAVVDHTTVIAARHESDAAIEAQAQENVYNDASDAHAVTIATNDGRVTLSGAVASQAERASIEGDVEMVPGVTAVEDDLSVPGYVPETHLVAATSMKKRVVDSIFWDPRVDDRRVHVDVSAAGDVTLTGFVDTREAAQAATDDALRAGAAHVTDELRSRD